MTTLYYMAGFRAGTTAPILMTCTVAGNAATITAGTYAHRTLAAVSATSGYTAFSVAVKSALDGAGGGPYTVTYDTSAHTYTISRATNFTLTFSSIVASDVVLAHALGYATGTLSGATSYTSTVRPYYVIVPTELARSNALPWYFEPSDITTEAVSDGGTAYGASKNTSELWSNWTQSMEAKAAVFSASAAAGAPWTWQHFFQHARMTYPFAVYDSGAGFDAVYQLRADGTGFTPKAITPDWDSIYTVSIKARYLGTL